MKHRRGSKEVVLFQGDQILIGVDQNVVIPVHIQDSLDVMVITLGMIDQDQKELVKRHL